MPRHDETKALVESVFYTMEKKNYNLLQKDDMKALFQDKGSFDYFASALSEGLTEGDSKEFKILLENSRKEFLIESNTAESVSAFATLSPQLLRNIFPRLIAREAVSNKVLTSPQEQVGFMKQFFRSHDGKVTDIPSALNVNSVSGPMTSAELSVPSTVDLFEVSGYSKAGGSNIDRRIKISSVVIEGTKKDGTTELVTLNQTIVADENSNFKQEVVGVTSDGEVVTDKLFASVNRNDGTFEVVSMKGLIKKVNVDFIISLEANIYSGTIENKFDKILIQVSEGDTLNTSLPFQYLKDTKALFDIDAQAEAVNTLGATFAQIIDIELIADIRNGVEMSATRADQTLSYDASIIVNGAHSGITRQMQNAALLDRINRSIGIAENRVPFNGAMTYYVLANPIDAAIIASGVTPEFKGTLTRGGVITNYNTVSLQGISGEIVVLSSKLVPDGAVYVIPKSNIDNEIVYGYYDYSQVVVPTGYLNPQKPNVTNIAMINRRAKKFFRPEAIQKIEIKNNRAE